MSEVRTPTSQPRVFYPPPLGYLSQVHTSPCSCPQHIPCLPHLLGHPLPLSVLNPKLQLYKAFPD